MKLDPTTELLAAMSEYELDPGTIVWDGKLRRFPGPGKKRSNDDGWYTAFPDKFGAFFGDHSRGIHEHWKLHNGKKPDDLDPDEWKRMKEQAREAQAEREREREAEQAEVAQECKRRWNAASEPDPEHSYLKAKGVTEPDGLRQEGEHLLVPMKALDTNEITSIQTIAPDGTKLFTPGGRTAETRTTIGAAAFKDDGTLYICEGWATGHTIHEVTGHTVVVAFSAQNLEPVAVYHREKYPSACIIVAADNDRWTETYRGGERVPNPGLVFAKEAADAASAQVVVPNFHPGSKVCLDPECPRTCGGEHPTDFNDLVLLEGSDAVKHDLEPRAEPEPEPEPPDESAPPPEDTPPPEVPPSDDKASAEGHDTWVDRAPFRCLGYDRGSYFYLPRESGQINVLTAAGHDRKTLLPLAPLAWWEQNFPQKNGADWTMAADALMRASHHAGVFRPENLRGRGCWPDEDGIILHLGDRLLPPNAKAYVDPESYRCSSNLIYERLPRITGPSKKRAMDTEQTNDLLSLFTNLLWQQEASGYLLAGWTALAPLCGALKWRPHVWVCGGHGAGKTVLLNELVVPLLGGRHGGMVCPAEGGTTEAGIRQRLRADALPVVYDEAERNDSRSGHRLQAVISLARSASSTGSETLKGTTHGSALSFQVRSMFCLASIGGAVREEADKSRISLLQLRSAAEMDSALRREHWDRYGPQIKAVDEGVGRELIARTLRWLRDGRLEDTLTVFRAAATTVLGEARAGDQYGTLYAGAWTMMADNPPDPVEAREYIASSDLDFYLSEQMPEGLKALQVILQQRERIETKNGPQTVAIGELLDAAREFQSSIPAGDAKNVLRQVGLRVDMRDGDWVLYVANNSEWIGKALSDTPYAENVATALRTVRGAEAGGMIRFHPGLASRTTRVPLVVLDRVD